MSTPAAKRRRIEVASRTLSKPFQSPLKTAARAAAQGDHSPATAHKAANPATSSDQPRASLPYTRGTAAHKLTKGPSRSGLTAAAINDDPVVSSLLKSQRELEKQMRELREELDITTQARKIETDSEKNDPSAEVDVELLALTRKWKDVSRGAAEELFTGVRERVNQMGGPKAWKQAQQRQREVLAQFNDEPRLPAPDPRDDERTDYEGEDLRTDCDAETESAREKEARCGTPDVDEESDEEFTMATMLGTLHIDLKVIGYDKKLQRWED
ncbi:MAG: hypothetical protein M1818_001997 [Claussenomyces sp. TS43310]|nr:MAG: hypothetical protein M1818_001997 [Claussenomyces sp. TS43310]